MKIKSIAAIMAALMLTGCLSAQERYERAQAQAQAEREQQQREQAAYMAGLSARCTQFGLTGDRHGQCMLQLHQQNVANRGAAISAILQGAAAAEIGNRPPCSSLPPFLAGYRRASGECR